MAATQCPELLPGDMKDKIKNMKEILDLMETKKHKHLKTLRWLQRQPHQNVEDLGHDNNSNSGWDDEDDDDDDNGQVQQGHRASNRLANKNRIDYRAMNKRGFNKDY